MVTTGSRASLLRPYLPRLTFEWLDDDPDRRWRSVDGSVVFVDISGFTKLSEKLAKSGKVGAEEMADAINHTFTELLAIAYEEDGSLIKFGGDALLLLFTGGEPWDHATRAVRAAAGMRRRLRTVGKIQTTRGQVGLRMSVGVHTGVYDFFLVGESHRELLVTGPGATQVVTMEGTADAGEICLSPTTASLLPSRCVGEKKGPGYLLRATPPGQPSGLVSVIPSVSDELLESCVSVANREQLMAGSREPEHRQASVAFLHFEDTDEMREHEGPEKLADALHELVVCVQGAVDEYQVSFLASDVDADGGKIIMTAGVPRAIGDDEERMLLALRRITDAGVRMRFRIGVNHGAVFSGDIGPRYRRTYTVMGDTVNLAARVMSKAPPGQLYATGSVLDLSATRFELTEIEPFMVKGKAKPVQAWAVGAALGSKARETSQSMRLPLVGRDEEIGSLERLALDACAGTGHLVEIVGEPGIGKTRLLEELVDRECGLRIMHATAEAYTSSTPYAIWRELLREMLGLGWEDTDEVVAARLHETVGSLDPELIPWLPLLGDAIDAEVARTPEVDAIAPEFRRPKLHEVVGLYLGKALTAPTLIQIEDAHLMDPASSELLASLAPSLAERPWLIAVARRDVGTGFSAPEGESVARVDLGPLSAEAARAMVLTATEDTPLLPHDEELVASRSGGNPQFLLDLVQAVASGSMLPDSVEAAATARIDSLRPDDRTLVRRASVFGVSFHPRFLADVLDEGSPQPDDRTWERLAEFFEDDGDGYVRFRRIVVRDAAYGGLPFRTRRALHATVGARLERDVPDADEASGLLSLHFFLAGENEKAYRYAGVAARRAAERYANEEAAHLFRRTIEAGRRAAVPHEELVPVYEALGDVLRYLGLLADAAAAFASARRLAAGEPVARARLLMKRSIVEERLGRYPSALRWLTKARATLADADASDTRALAAEIDARYAAVLWSEGRLRAATRRCEEAIAAAEASGARSAEAGAHNIMAAILATRGQPGAEDHWRRALAIFEELGDLPGQAMILGNLGAGAYFEGRWNVALELYGGAVEASERTGDPLSAAVAELNIVEILADQGRYDEAESAVRKTMRVWRASGEKFTMAFCLAMLGRIAGRTGRLDEAVSLFEEARLLYLDVGAKGDALDVDARQAEALVAAGRSRDALELAERTLGDVQTQAAGSISLPLLERVIGYARLQTGDLDGAEAMFEESLAESRERGSGNDVALATHAIARVRKLRGLTTEPELLAEADDRLQHLGVVAVLAPPLVAC